MGNVPTPAVSTSPPSTGSFGLLNTPLLSGSTMPNSFSVPLQGAVASTAAETGRVPIYSVAGGAVNVADEVVTLPTGNVASTVAPVTHVSPSSVPVVVVNTPQAVRPYNGSTNHFVRVAKVNKWEDVNTQAQHLMLALEGNAAEVLKEISDSSPTVLQDIWDALSRRFGEVDEAREALRKFEQRRQSVFCRRIRTGTQVTL